MEEHLHADGVAYRLCGDRAWKLDHGEAVAELAYRTALAIGLDERKAARIRLAAFLHDIGKVEISDHVLLKPGPLTVDEWAQIRLHPVLGEQILTGEGLGDIAPWVRSHHERHDGLGYPDGLTGSVIPLEARIIAVAEAYDAMVQAQPFSRPIPPAEARAELRREAGFQFDPGVVAAFLRAVALHGAPIHPAGERELGLA